MTGSSLLWCCNQTRNTGKSALEYCCSAFAENANSWVAEQGSIPEELLRPRRLVEDIEQEDVRVCCLDEKACFSIIDKRACTAHSAPLSMCIAAIFYPWTKPKMVLTLLATTTWRAVLQRSPTTYSQSAKSRLMNCATGTRVLSVGVSLHIC